MGFKTLWEREGPHCSPVPDLLCGFLVSIIGAACQPGVGDSRAGSKGWSVTLNGVQQPQSSSGVTQGMCFRDGFALLQQISCKTPVNPGENKEVLMHPEPSCLQGKIRFFKWT